MDQIINRLSNENIDRIVNTGCSVIIKLSNAIAILLGATAIVAVTAKKINSKYVNVVSY